MSRRLITVFALLFFAAALCVFAYSSARHTPPVEPEIAALADRVDRALVHDDNTHERYAIVCIRHALLATTDGNYGVGACLVGPEGEVVVAEHNHVYFPYHRGDLHAEMSVFLKAEEQFRDNGVLEKQCTLYTSVEPCMMCFARTIGSGVRCCYYVADDEPSGMVHLSNGVPPSYKQHMKNRTFMKCVVSSELEQLAKDIYTLSFLRLGTKTR